MRWRNERIFFFFVERVPNRKSLVSQVANISPQCWMYIQTPSSKVAQGNQLCSCAHLTPNQGNILATFCFETNDVLLTVWQLVVYSEPFDSDASILGRFGRNLVPVTHRLITVNMHFLPSKRVKSIMWELEEWVSPLVQALVCWMTSELGQVWLIASLVSLWQLILSRKRLRMQMVFVKDACECVDVFFFAVEFVLNKQKRLSPSHSFWLKTSDAVVWVEQQQHVTLVVDMTVFCASASSSPLTLRMTLRDLKSTFTTGTIISPRGPTPWIVNSQAIAGCCRSSQPSIKWTSGQNNESQA